MEKTELVEHVINVSVLSELLISEMEHLQDTPFWSKQVKHTGNKFYGSVINQTDQMYKVMGDEASAQFNGQIDLFNSLFDAICKMDVDQRMDLIEHINTHNKYDRKDNQARAGKEPRSNI